jgi:hypothetical protein
LKRPGLESSHRISNLIAEEKEWEINRIRGRRAVIARQLRKSNKLGRETLPADAFVDEISVVNDL